MPRIMHTLLRASLLSVSLISAPITMAQSNTPETLIDAWLGWQQQRQSTERPPLDWAYSFALLEAHAGELTDKRARLIAEIDGLGAVMAATSQPQLTDTLANWAEHLRDMPALPARSAAPLGLMSLAGDLRRNPPMADITTLGTCRPPTWVEAWTHEGVQRITWRSGMTLDSLIEHWPPSALRRSDTITVITPSGTTRILGIAPWNHQDAALAPGARLAVRLPEHSQEAQIINRELADFLATRLPGDDCTLWPN